MGYDTTFEGRFKLDKRLEEEHFNELVSFYEAPHDGKEYPGRWCQWTPTSDGLFIDWDGGEKFYAYVEWIQYLVDNFLKPWGYILNGEVKYHGEESTDIGTIIVKDNVVVERKTKIEW